MGAYEFGDKDADGTADCADECPSDPTKIAAGACGCGTADTDTDADGTADCNDGCPADANKTTAGACGCARDQDCNAASCLLRRTCNVQQRTCCAPQGAVCNNNNQCCSGMCQGNRCR